MDILTEIFGVQAQYTSWDKQDQLPLYIAGSYEFQGATLGGVRCIVLTPTEELATLPALKKQIQRIEQIDHAPVVLKLPAISAFRRKKMIEERIAFVTGKQVFLPFMGAYFTGEDEETPKVDKLMFSAQQLALLYLYNGEAKLYAADALTKLPFTAMTMSRAVKQLEATGLFRAVKDGVRIVIESPYQDRELYEKLKVYMTSPVRKSGYLNREDMTEDMVLAGESALAEVTMLNPGRVMTYAVYGKNFDQAKVDRELVDPAEQIRVELWAYDPRQFSGDDMADPLSVALSLEGNQDERIEEALEELLERLVEGVNGYRV